MLATSGHALQYPQYPCNVILLSNKIQTLCIIPVQAMTKNVHSATTCLL